MIKHLHTSLKVIIALVSILVLTKQSKADHFIGSDITWECVSSDKYKVILTFYQDCNGCHLGVKPTGCTFELCGLPGLSVKSKCGTKTYSFKQIAHKDITPVCPGQCSRCTDCTCSFQYGIRKHTLEAVIDVSSEKKNGCCDFTLSYYSCCRSVQITTGAAVAGFYSEASMNACQTPCDNSPAFTTNPVAILCVGKDFIYNQGAYDKDVNPKTGGLADSLVYSFNKPMSSATTPTNWTSPYSYDKPIYFLGFPKSNLTFPRGLHLDSATGDLMFRPMKVEITVLAIQVEEYRDGKLIGITRRDIEVIVIKCPSNETPVISGINCKNPVAANFKTDACAGEKLCFTVCTSDKDKDDTTTIAWNAGIPSATFKVLNPGDKRENGQFCWTPSEGDVSKFPYSFVVTTKDNACPVNGYSARSFQITVKNSPKATYDTVIYDCGNAKFTATKTGAVNISQFMWNLNGFVKVTKGGTSSEVTTKFNSSGKKRFSLSLIGSNGCIKLYEDTVTVPEFITAALPPDTSVCAGTKLDFSTTLQHVTGTPHIKWTTGDEDKTFASITVGSKDTFIAVSVYDDVCDNADTVFIHVNTPPNVNLGADKRLCFYESAELGAEITNIQPKDADSNYTYKWFRNTTANYFSNLDTVTVSDSGFYILQVSDSLKCIGSDTMQLKMNPERKFLPDNEVICFKEDITFKVKETSKNSQFTWYNSLKKPLKISGTGETYTHKPLVSQWYGLQWKETLNGITCEKFDSIYVKVNELPKITLTKPSDVCVNGDPINLYLLGSPLGGEWFENRPKFDYVQFGKFYPANAEVKNNIPTSNIIGYTYEDLGTGCKDTAWTSVNVKPLPSVILSKDTVPMCTGESNRLLNTYVTTEQGGDWTGNGVIKVANSSTAGGFDFFFDPTDPSVNEKNGYYELIYSFTKKTGTQPWCGSADTMFLRLIKVPVVDAGIYSDVCIDDPEFALGKAVPNDGNGEWYYMGTPLTKTRKLLPNNKVDPSLIKEGTHTYQFVYKVPDSQCSDSSSTDIIVHELPIPVSLNKWFIGDGKNRICITDSLGLKGNTDEGGFAYKAFEWTGPGVKKLSATKYQFRAASAKSGEKELTYKVVNRFGCKASIKELVTVDALKFVAFTNGIVCLGDSVPLKLTSKNVSSVKWTTSGDGVFDNDTLLQATYIPGQNDNSVSFKLTVTSTGPISGCPEVDSTNELVVYPLPLVDFELSEDTVCAPKEILLTNNTTIESGDVVDFQWIYGDGKVKSTSSTKTQMHEYGVLGQEQKFKIKVIATSDIGCVDSSSRTLVTLLTPQALFAPKPSVTTIMEPEVYFENFSVYTNRTTTYEWDFIDHNAADSGISDQFSPWHRYSDTGTFNVRLVATNFNSVYGKVYGCSDTNYQIVKIKPEILVFVPNTFTPFPIAGDQNPMVNDSFKAVVSGVVTYDIRVFNRWGELMWSSTNPNEAWDGIHNGVHAKSDVYVYVIKASNNEGKEYEFTGTVTLIR